MKKTKRESRVKSFFGKFKRNSRSIDESSSKKETEKPVEKTSARNSAAVGGAAAATTVVAGGAVGAGVATHEDSVKEEPSNQEKKDEFHKAVTSATDPDVAEAEDADEEGLYSAPSAEVHTAVAVPVAVPVAEVSADPGTPAENWASSTQHDVQERGASIDVSRPSTAIPTHTSTTDTAATAPEQVSVRNSVTTTSDEYEEARDKFDEDDSHETATLKAPEPARRLNESSPSRPTSKFQEELED